MFFGRYILLFWLLLSFSLLLPLAAYAKFRPTGTPVALQLLSSETFDGEKTQYTRLTTDQGVFVVVGAAVFIFDAVVYRLDAAMEDGSLQKTFLCGQSFTECFVALEVK